ncbi:centriole, cilia and spindle-associated protein isoform X1 [Takifugu rubripes]|uniref:centriole, cilia and spindle-associated protein isoform X1 n=1 Tax=Takifugu rubripes TaxID=31033 RepID=UPI0005D188F9|nr:centriole, cilia and spindle-associated protein-like isoform X1 [Takifugu rubripes]XP_011607909.1 centriole, cilia and spindle-associated protein-like isoform X1 [Takifugu rubripes]|eukprot:XP_011607908.1 PREDICTED: centriole, cilia and spindle-associated protein-like isoform X1 [Takifugu rubripes]
MVTRRLRSEYMKKFKDPKWETYNKCYEDTLKYRLTRRLLEQTHNPWFWRGSDTDSDSGGRSPLSLSKVRPEAHTEACGDRLGPDPMVPRLPLQDELEEVQMSAPHLVINGETGARGTQAQEERVCNGGKQLTMTKNQKEKEAGQTKQTQPSKFSKRSWRVSAASTQQRREESMHRRHPFALYGSGEKDASMAGRKTHNVCPAASTREIHESALRAKTRREVERQIQIQRAECRRAKSADLVKARKVVQPEFNPWLTEYMRCFSGGGLQH